MVASSVIGGVGTAWAAKPVTGWVARSTGAQSVALIEGERPGTWIDLYSGDILESRPNTDTLRTTHGGRVIWEETRFDEDREGGTHDFHQQRYLPPTRVSIQGLQVPANGFQIRGSSIGFHSDSSGHLFGIAGTRFLDIKVVIKPALVTPAAALESAITGARAQRADIAFLESLDEQEVKRLLKEAKIELASSGDGETFGFIWTLKVATISGPFLIVDLDAADGEVLSMFDGVVSVECTPDTNSHVAVGAASQRDGVFYPALPSTEAPGLEAEFPGYTREAHRAASPEIIVYMGEEQQWGDQCPEGGNQFFRVFPLTSEDDGDTWYDDWQFAGRTIMGRSAADAMKHTIQTLTALGHYGWSSYDGHGGTARIAVDSNCPVDNAFFDVYGVTEDFPHDGVGICKRSDPLNSQLSAALDIVAHEWGHGVVKHSAGWPYDQTSGALHEGFADMIGYGVEWHNRPGASNWTLGEDALLARRVDVDDGISAYHQCDSTAFEHPGFYQEVGNMIGVVFRMMAEGVRNPGDPADCNENRCSNPDSPPGVCGVFSLEPDELEMDHAFRFLLELLLYYTSPSTAWENLPGLATMLGTGLGPPAKADSGKILILPGGGGVPECINYYDFSGASSAHAAFTAIGYPPYHQLIGPCE